MKAHLRSFMNLLRNDRRIGLFIGLLAVALLLWGRILIKEVPRQAAATEDKPAPKTRKPAAPETEPLSANSGVRTIYVTLSETLQRDLFAIDSRHFAQSVAADADSITQEKSAAHPADEREAAGLAAGLRLQSTVLGVEPRALINGQVMTPGEIIRGFRLQQVLDRQVVLERDGLAIVLRM